MQTYPQFASILAVSACIKNYINVGVRTNISFIAVLPLTVIARRVENRGIAEVEGLI